MPTIALTLALILALASSSTASADEGRIPIYQQTTILQPGHYVLTRDITGVGGNVIVIDSDNVSLDLGGRTVTSSGTPGFLVHIPNGRSDIVVRNGRLVGGNSGVRAAPAPSRSRILLEDLEIVNATLSGISIENAGHVEVLSCRVFLSAASSVGIMAGSTGGTGYAGRFIGNTVDGAGQHGMLLNNLTGGEVRGNLVANFGSALPNQAGIWIGSSPVDGGNLVQGNIVRNGGSDDDGIVVSNGFSSPNRLVANVVTGNGGHGIRSLSSGNVISDNTVAANGGDAIHLQSGSYNLVERNQAEGNAGCGLYFGTVGENVYRANMLRGNTGGSVCGAVNTDAGGNIL